MTRSLRPTRRHAVWCLAALIVTATAGCHPATPSATESTPMSRDSTGPEVVRFDVSTLSYIERPVFEIKLNGVEVGLGGGGLMTGVAVPLGPQVVTWRLDGPKGMPGNGETVQAVNQPVLVRPDPKFRYLGVHIYPDNTVELIPEEFWPQRTARGETILRAQAGDHGK